MTPVLATASSWTSELTDAGAQLLTDGGVAIAAGVGVFVVFFGVSRIINLFSKVASKG